MTPNTEGTPSRVLIVDDEPDIETLVRRRFKRRNGDYAFTFARNGEEAMQALAADPALDLVVTDINMPVMDGLMLLNRLQELDGRIIKAVILSAYGDMQNIRTAMNRGAFDFLTKPIDFEDFESTLKRTRNAINAIREGQETQAQLVALQQELEIAARIQSSILPQKFISGRTDFGIYAEMLPARIVGGDFYDFFLLDENRLGFVIGDVSGKGIPAALFMAVTRTLVEGIAKQGLSPAECLKYANQVLGDKGEAGVFVTLFYGILHTGTGVLEFGLGGHNPPYRISSDGSVQPIAEPGGAVVGLIPECCYETGRLQLEKGDSIFLFTDGVTEAMDAGLKFFGERRLKEILSAHAGDAPKELVRAVLQAVKEYTATMQQADDITALAVRWTP
jgi:sigma-B regulation protein RsbU (phosphoserine phosphatase)